MNRFPLNSFSSRKPYTPNHPHSLDSHNGFPARVGTARVSWRPEGFRHSALALPGFPGAGRVSASQDWHCQGFPARGGFPPLRVGTARISGQKPLMIGTARDYWRRAASRHPALALPGFSGAGRVLASQDWHCQEFLAPGGLSPLRVGTARDSWRGAGPRHSALALPGFRGAGRVLSSPPHTSF